MQELKRATYFGHPNTDEYTQNSEPIQCPSELLMSSFEVQVVIEDQK